MGFPIILTEGISAILPEHWDYSAEADDQLLTHALLFSSTSIEAQLELLNPRDLSGKDFISEYRFTLLGELSDLSLSIKDFDHTFPNEIQAVDTLNQRIVIHILLPTEPVAHISAITTKEEEIIELRKFSESLIIDNLILEKNQEDLIPMVLSPAWKKDPSEDI